jgi:hypothetical protein
MHIHSAKTIAVGVGKPDENLVLHGVDSGNPGYAAGGMNGCPMYRHRTVDNAMGSGIAVTSIFTTGNEKKPDKYNDSKYQDYQFKTCNCAIIAGYHRHSSIIVVP